MRASIFPRDPNTGCYLPATEEVIVSACRHKIGLAIDALQRALDQLPDEPPYTKDKVYVRRQLVRAHDAIDKARLIMSAQMSQSAMAAIELHDASDEPITAQLPNVPAQDVTEGGGA